MKKYLIILIFPLIYIMSTSCEKKFGDFLEQAPGVTVTEDTIFSKTSQVEKFLATCYEQGIIITYPQMRWISGSNTYSNHLGTNSPYASGPACDEGDYTVRWFSPCLWNTGSVDPNQATVIDMRYYPRWSAIRDFNIMLERVDKVPDMDQSYKDRIKGEMKFLRALNYFDILRNYGGAPIVRKRFLLTDQINIPRNSIDSVVTFIIKDCDDAAAILPDSYISNLRGHATKGAALALKSRTLLYAASPLFNTGTPYLSMPNSENNNLICYGNYDPQRWQKAADAAKAVIDWAPSGGISLITSYAPDQNYLHTWNDLDNNEIILSDKITNGQPKNANTGMPWSTINPLWTGSWTSLSVTQNFIERIYYNRYTGKKIAWQSSGLDLNEKYDSLDYRFRSTVGYNNSSWRSNVTILELHQAGNGFPAGAHLSDCVLGNYVHKGIPYVPTASTTVVQCILFRLAEAYLNYAEALNEVNSAPPQAAYDAINILRARTGMPNLPTGLTQAQFRDFVIIERGAELAYEDHRFWDIRRWMIAEQDGVMQGSIYGLKIYKTQNVPTRTFSYTRYVQQTRVFKRQHYLSPFALTDINKSRGVFLQNPGY